MGISHRGILADPGLVAARQVDGQEALADALLAVSPVNRPGRCATLMAPRPGPHPHRNRLTVRSYQDFCTRAALPIRLILSFRVPRRWF